MSHVISPPSTIGGRIKQIRLARGMTQKVFADSLGIVQGFLSAVEHGNKTPSDTLVIALCRLYDIRRDWLLSGRGEMVEGKRVDALSTGDDSHIPLLKRITADFPTLAPADRDGYIQLPDIPPGCYALRVEGDFMAPTINDGDLVIFQADAGIDNRDIVLITNHWGEVILRRYRLQGDEVYFSAENSVYSPFRPDPKTRTIGKVVAIWRRIKI